MVTKHRPESGLDRRAHPRRRGCAAALGLAAVLAAPAAGRPQSRLIWSDEFSGTRLDPEKWSVASDCRGGGNEERQCYTDRPANVSVADGLLRITARREPVNGPGGIGGGLVARQFTSAKVLTRGHASFRYGRIEVRALLAGGQGAWPAIWLLPEHDNYGPYPQSGEIDLAEAVDLGATCRVCPGGRENRIYAALHHGLSPRANRQIGGSDRLIDPSTFHVFALDWTPDTMTWLVDGRPYFRAPTRPPFDQRFHLIVNLAVGGRWAEAAGTGGVDGAAFPATLLVDWVRVYASPSSQE